MIFPELLARQPRRRRRELYQAGNFAGMGLFQYGDFRLGGGTFRFYCGYASCILAHFSLLALHGGFQPLGCLPLCVEFNADGLGVITSLGNLVVGTPASARVQLCCHAPAAKLLPLTGPAGPVDNRLRRYQSCTPAPRDVCLRPDALRLPNLKIIPNPARARVFPGASLSFLLSVVASLLPTTKKQNQPSFIEDNFAEVKSRKRGDLSPICRSAADCVSASREDTAAWSDAARRDGTSPHLAARLQRADRRQLIVAVESFLVHGKAVQSGYILPETKTENTESMQNSGRMVHGTGRMVHGTGRMMHGTNFMMWEIRRMVHAG